MRPTVHIELTGNGSLAPTVDQGLTASLTFFVVRTNCVEDLTPTIVSGLPPDVTATFNPPVLTVTQGYCQVTFAAAADATPGTFPIVIRCTGATVRPDDIDATVTVVVNTSPAIALGLSPSAMDVVQGQSNTATVSVARTNTTEEVTLSVSGLPSGLSGSFAPNPVTSANQSSVLTVTDNVGASVVVNDTYQVSGAATGITIAPVNGTVSVIAAGGAGQQNGAAVVEDDFANYPDDAAFRAVQGTGLMYNSGSFEAAELGPSSVDPSRNCYRILILNDQSQAQMAKTNFTPILNAGFYFEHAYQPGFTTVGTMIVAGSNPPRLTSHAYKALFLTYSGANGRVGFEWTSTNSMVLTGGWTNSGAGNYSTAAAIVTAFGAPFGTTAPDGAWNVAQTIAMYLSVEYPDADTQVVRMWSWLKAGPTPTLPLATLICKRGGGTLRPIAGISFGANYNHGPGYRPAAPTAIEWDKWQLFNLDNTPNPRTLPTPPLVTLPTTPVVIARGTSVDIPVVIERGTYTGTITVAYQNASQMSSRGLTLTVLTPLTAGVNATTLRITASAGATLGFASIEDGALVFAGIKVRYFLPYTVTV